MRTLKQILLKKHVDYLNDDTSSKDLGAYLQDGVIEWLKQKEQEMFINTVSQMDCELSAIRTETFEELLNDLGAKKQEIEP